MSTCNLQLHPSRQHPLPVRRIRFHLQFKNLLAKAPAVDPSVAKAPTSTRKRPTPQDFEDDKILDKAADIIMDLQHDGQGNYDEDGIRPTNYCCREGDFGQGQGDHAESTTILIILQSLLMQWISCPTTGKRVLKNTHVNGDAALASGCTESTSTSASLSLLLLSTARSLTT